MILAECLLGYELFCRKDFLFRGEATNGELGEGGGGACSNRNLFCIIATDVVQKSLMFLHRVNNIENNIKQNIYTDMKVISLIAP